MIVIHEVALFDLVVGHLDTSTQFWQDHHHDILVLDKHGLVVLVHFLVADRLNDGIRINHSTRTLIDTLLQKHRVLLWCSYLIGGYRNYFSPSFYHIFFCLQFTVYSLQMITLEAD